MTLIAGIAVPFIENPFLSVQPVVQTVTQVITPVNNLTEDTASTTASEVADETNSWNGTSLVLYLWLAGAIFQIFLLIRNVSQLYFLKKYSSKNQHPIADFYSNKNTPAAFSFGKLIYLPETAYNAQDLRLILQHEQLHAQHKHWIDNTVLELLQIVFWFHPLFHLFKKQIKLVHEYQVDQEIDVADQYDYAKLLLAQNNKAYINKLIHTFNFSPLKNRIAMMTNSKKVSSWKYVLTLPVIALCFGLMSASPKSDQRIRNGNTTTFRGNTIVWQAGGVDTLEVTDPATGETIIQKIDQNDRVKKVNGHEVAEGIFLSLNMGSAEFANPELEAISKNIQQALKQNRSKFPENIAFLQIENIVLDKNLNVYYYDVRTGGVNMTDTTLAGLNKFPGVNKEVDKILKNKKQINPANIVLNKDYYTLQAWIGFQPDQVQVELKRP
ncbi:MAG: hypothetical protein BGO31_07005 [Bacteroidetes bacterium 43-16]|nr:MAG: hypothetical protein BGO31_07005 [Bacteroidetes bacterium 43-16]